MTLSLTDEKTVKQAEVKRIKDYMTGEAFADGKSKNIEFIMQYYQREYEWDEQQIENLLNIIFNVNFSNNEEYIESEIGSLIIQPITENQISLMDGQQRTTTLSLIALFLEQLLIKTISVNEEEFKKNSNLPADKNKKEIQSLYKEENRYLSDLTDMFINNEEKSPKINFINSPKYNDFYASLIENREEVFKKLCEENKVKNKFINILTELSYPDKNINKDLLLFKSTLEALNSIYEFFKQELKITYDINYGLFTSKISIKDFKKIIHRFFQTLITIEIFSSEVNPSIVFQNKNNTGKKLKAIDLIKSVFILAENSTDYGKKINTFFKKLKTELGEDNFNRYVIAVFKINETKIVKSEKIISIEKLTTFLNNSRVKKGNWTDFETVKFYKNLEVNELKYKKIKGLSPSFPAAITYLYILKNLDLIDLYTPILLEKYPNENDKKGEKEFLKLLREIIKIYFIAVYNGANNNKINLNIMNISVFPDLLEEVKNNNSVEKFISKKLFFQEVDESKIFDKWEAYNFNQVRKGILYLYELSLIKGKLEECENSIFMNIIKEDIQIEHIIPTAQKKLIKHNSSYVKLNKKELDKPGNFILLDKLSNEDAKDNIFAIKKQKVYEKQINQLKQIELLYNKQNFSTIDDINERTKEIIERIYKFINLI